MTELKTEYTDIKNIRHRVEHLTASADNEADAQSIAAELYNALSRNGHHTAV